MTIQAEGAQGHAQPERVLLRLWINAFIPRDFEGAEPVPGGPHAGKAMLSAPGPMPMYFLTDQRDFSADPTAHSRMHSELTLALPSCEVVREAHCCDDTVQVDPETGEELCRETPSTDDMAFSDFRSSAQARTWSCSLNGSTANACIKVGPIKVSPKLDYKGLFNVTWNEDASEVTIVFDGQVETYPAFEMYASLDGGQAETVFQLPVEPGTSPMNLAGPPTRAVLKQVTLSRMSDARRSNA